MQDDAAPRPDRVAFVDFEASSLGSASYPIEIGWAMIHEGRILSGACLIKATAKWLLSNIAWSAKSEALTGITREMLDRRGVSPREGMRRFLAAVHGRLTLSDEPSFGSFWLSQLAEAADMDPVKLGDAKAVIDDAARRHGKSFAQIAAGFPVRHRAEPDARRLVLSYARAAGIEVIG